jgi:dTDP-4-amino-4,6-dideoxygalactose transaminase
MKFYNTKKNLPITEKITKQIVSIPCHPNLQNNDIDRIIKFTNKFC